MGVFVAERWIDSVVQIKWVTERLMVVQVTVGGSVLNVISVYAPQVGRTLDEKMDFSAALDKVLTEVVSDEQLMVCGNFNGHVGESIDGFEGVHGESGFGARNLESEVLLEFADSHCLVITNTCFTKVDSKKITYESGGNRSVVDYILVRVCQCQMESDVTVIND